jgi:hypothetical protein
LIQVHGRRINMTDQSGLEALAMGEKPLAGPVTPSFFDSLPLGPCINVKSNVLSKM